MNESIEVSAGLVPAFVALVFLMAGVLIAGVHRVTGGRTAARWAAGLALWLALTLALAARGVLTFEGLPPTMPILLVITIAASIRIALSRTGERLALGVPLGLLVLSQAFRLPLELIMHRLGEDGLMPVQMSYSGLNFDILTGLLAIPVGLLALTGRAPRGLVAAWNVLGTLLLVNVVTIALLSAPTPMRVFMNEPANVWVTQAPWVWLPTLLVPLALIGHIVVFRRLRHDARAGAPGRGDAAVDQSRGIARSTTPAGSSMR